MNSDEVSLLRLFGKVRRQANLTATHSLKKYGIGTKQALVLRELKAAKAASAAQIAKLTHTDPTATGKIIDSLIKKKWIKRTDDPGDRRRWLITLTAHGHSISRQLDQVYGSIAENFCKPLNNSQKAEFSRALSLISEHLELTEGKHP